MKEMKINLIKRMIDSIELQLKSQIEISDKISQILDQELKFRIKEPQEFNADNDEYDIFDFLVKFDVYC